MRRFVLLWAVLALVQWAAGTAVDLAGFRRLDWTFEAFCAALLVPAAQAAALCRLVPERRAIALGSAWGAVAGSLPVRALLAADAALLLAGFLVPRSSPWSAARPSAAFSLAIAAQVGAAGLLALGLSARAGTSGERAALAAAGVAALAAAAAVPAPVRRRAAALLLPRAAEFARFLVVGVGGFALGIGLLLAAAWALSRRHPAAGRILDTSAAPALAAGAIVALSVFRFPRVLPPWDGVVRALSLVGAAAALASLAAAFRPERRAPSPEGR